MVSKKVTQRLILGAVALGSYAAWTAYTSHLADENIRPAAVTAINLQTGSVSTTDAADLTAGGGDRKFPQASYADRAMPTSAGASKTPADSNRIEAFTEPYSDIKIAASEMGTLSHVNVKEGDVVKSGDVIAIMPDVVLKASLEVARRSMNVEGTLQSAAADVALRKTELAKLQQLRLRDHASQQEVDRVVAELTMAEARHLSVREDLEIKKLEMHRIEAQLEQRRIRTPIAGIVTEITKDVGEFVSPSEPVVARVVQLDPLLVVFSVPLEHRNEFQPDQSVTLQLGNTSQTVSGTVEFVSRTTDQSNSSIRVKVRLPNPNGDFQSGERLFLNLNQPTSPDKPATSSDTVASPVADRTHEITSRQ